MTFSVYEIERFYLKREWDNNIIVNALQSIINVFVEFIKICSVKVFITKQNQIIFLHFNYKFFFVTKF